MRRRVMAAAATTSAWEFEQQRDTASALARLCGRVSLGEADWTGRTDNSGLGLRVLRDPAVEDDDLDELYYDEGYR